ncbi:hypothetical protein CLV25_10157 [Acetobacteroides hydrogenigenes]|uniref:Uncharacterized protein n=1 Tax=Acetobacteroides hydrogenigenes TaxID=979970 RepID=A0A4R2EU71_9BACT|nr:hypothetical protein CLV25_10157 [Acetobacteroides hydrogenigenes]
MTKAMLLHAYKQIGLLLLIVNGGRNCNKIVNCDISCLVAVCMGYVCYRKPLKFATIYGL